MSIEKRSEKEIEALNHRLLAIGKVLEELPSEVRSQAFELYEAYLRLSNDDDKPARKPEHKNHGDGSAEEESMEAFFGSFDHSKPADNVTLIAAWHYSQFGLSPLSKNYINKIANEVGITIPSRPDMTLKSKTAKAKNCFRQQARGEYVPTVHGEAFLKETYNVKRGKRNPAGDVAE